jgi:hypothetical protein
MGKTTNVKILRYGFEPHVATHISNTHVETQSVIYSKLKLSPYRPGQALGAAEG